jgi:hypothetical protein
MSPQYDRCKMRSGVTIKSSQRGQQWSSVTGCAEHALRLSMISS